MTADDLRYIIGHNVRQCRKARNISRRVFAETARISPTTVTNLEMGYSFSWDTLVRAADALHVDVFEFLQRGDC